MKLLERKILLAGLVVCLLLAVFAVFVLYQPRLAAQRRSAAEVARLTKELNATRERVKGIGRLRQRLAELEATNTAFAARVAPRSEMLSLLARLASEAQQQKVRFLEIAPPGLDTLLQEENAGTPLRGVPFIVTCQGRYIEVGQYLEGLAKFPYFIRVPDFEVNAREDIRPEVEVKFLLNLYASSLASGGQL
jgi:Tfp pilus assembly protein PilO